MISSVPYFAMALFNASTQKLASSVFESRMDGKGRFLPSCDIAVRCNAGQRINIFVERLWRSLKYECVYLHAWESGWDAKAGVKKWMEFYNHKRPHSALGGRPPAVVYWQGIEATNPDQQVHMDSKKEGCNGTSFPSHPPPSLRGHEKSEEF